MPHRRLVSAAALAAVALYSRTGYAHTDTSTAGIQFPEDSGYLPRAKIPEGSAERPYDVKPEVKPGDYDPPLDENMMHTHRHEHGGKEHTHAHSHANGPSHDHLHEDGPEESAPLELVEPQKTSTAAPAEDMLHFSIDGYLKVIAEVIENDPLSKFIGRNDGFRVGNARVGITAAYGPDLSAYISLEASVPRTEDFNQPNAELTVGPRDLFFSYQLSRQAEVTVGRFKAPYDASELESEGHRTFIDTPLESRGVAPTQGFQVLGMRQDRQIGLMLHRTRLGITDESFDLGYALALTNGRTESFALNDNDRPAGFARFSFYYGPWAAVNVGGFTDTRTVGELPNISDEETKGLEVSLQLALGDLKIEGQLLYQRTTFPTLTDAPRVNALGFHAQWSYRIWGLEAAYRFAYYDPNRRLEADAVNEHTLGLSYYVTRVPLRFSLNATLVQEQRGRELENSRLALLAQYNF